MTAQAASVQPPAWTCVAGCKAMSVS